MIDINALEKQILLTTREAATLLRISRQTLERMRCEGSGPPFIKIGRNVRYSQQDLIDWMGARRVRSTSEFFEEEIK